MTRRVMAAPSIVPEMVSRTREQAMRRAVREMLRLGATRAQLIGWMNEAHEALRGEGGPADEGDW